MSENRFDFDTVIDRRGTNCGKWDTMDKKYGNTDLIHLGVADMDFPSPQPIRDVVHQCADFVLVLIFLQEFVWEHLQNRERK